jgi:hypothetical protein
MGNQRLVTVGRVGIHAENAEKQEWLLRSFAAENCTSLIVV